MDDSARSVFPFPTRLFIPSSRKKKGKIKNEKDIDFENPCSDIDRIPATF